MASQHCTCTPQQNVFIKAQAGAPQGVDNLGGPSQASCSLFQDGMSIQLGLVRRGGIASRNCAFSGKVRHEYMGWCGKDHCRAERPKHNQSRVCVTFLSSAIAVAVYRFGKKAAVCGEHQWRCAMRGSCAIRQATLGSPEASPCSLTSESSAEKELPTQEKRPWCSTCHRPHQVCICDALPPTGPLDSATRIVLFIHPQETRRALTTAPLLENCLRNLITVKAMRFPSPDEDQELHSRLQEGGNRVVLMYPGSDAELLSKPSAIDTLPAITSASVSRAALTLILIDGRWSQAKGMLRRSPWLQELPRVTVPPTAPSQYIWRQQPERACVSTLEAVAEALLALEGRQGLELKAALFAPFKKMVELQCRYLPEVHDKNSWPDAFEPQSRRAKRKRQRRYGF